MERWEIRPTPTADDPQRHQLLLQGGPSDVAGLLKKFGALIGRPTPYAGEGYNLSLVLHRLKAPSRAKLEAWLTRAAPSAPTEPSAPAEPPAPGEPLPPIPVPEIPVLSALEPPPETIVLTAPSVSPAPEPVAPPPAATGLTELLAPLAPAAAPAPGEIPALPMLIPLRDDWTFETLQVGAYNRFAHAAAMSVVSSPGSMYNPLLLYGVPGTGKSHLLGAIRSALSKEMGDSVILHTSGSRLSRAVNVATAAKTMAAIDKKAADAKALLVDDIHLIGVSDQNKEALIAIFKSFFDRRQQVVLTSLYPPKAMGALEDALKFSFSKGWSVDIKVPSPAVQKDLINSAADRAGAGFGSEELALLHEKLSAWGYQDLSLWLRRAVIFKRMREAAGQASALSDMLHLIYEPLLEGASGSAKSPAPVAFRAPALTGAAEAIAVIVPKGEEGLGSYAASVFYEIGSKNGFNQAYRHVLWETYDASVPFGIIFPIGEMCHRAGVTRAIIVGPTPDSPLGPRSAEFSHALRRVLESLGVRLGWIPYAGLGVAAHYLNAHLDFAPDPVKP